MPVAQIRLALSSRVVWLDLVQGLAEDLGAQAGLGEDERFALSMSLREGVNNAILHGNRKDEAKLVEVLFVLHPDRLEVRIRDEGPGFDPSQLPDPVAPQNLYRASGRGVFLMRNYMDEVDLSAAGRRGGEIRLIKWLPGAAPVRRAK